MNSEEASGFVLDIIRGQVIGCVGTVLDSIRSGARRVSPFTHLPINPERARLHEKLKTAGLLDDTEFCADLATAMTDAASSPIWRILTWHDGSWGSEEGHQLELRIRGGPGLHDYLHELLDPIDPPTW